MKLIVTPHKIEIDKTPVNEKEIKVTEIEFEFSEEIPDNYVKDVYFTLENNTYQVADIQDNKCDIPYEVLESKGTVEIGVVAYLIENDEYVKRYNPSPVYISTLDGSLKDEYENYEEITPTDKEQLEQMLNNIELSVTKEGKITTIAFTNTDGETQTETLEDGMGLQFNWDGTSLGVKREDETTYEYVNLKGDKGEPGAIKMIIVAELPATGSDDTIYLVPITPDISGNNYAEYVYINGAWELLGKIGVQVDLTDYYTKQETYSKGEVDNLIPDLTDYVKNTDYATSSKGGVIKSDSDMGTAINTTYGFVYAINKNYSQYQDASNNMFIGKGTLENVITGKGLTTKTYVDGLVGDINTALDTINGEVI